MSDEALIRLNKLKQLMEDNELKVSDLVTTCGRTKSYWYDLLRGEKSFGEKAARSIEEGFDLPRFWLDDNNKYATLTDPQAQLSVQEPPTLYRATPRQIFSAEVQEAIKRLSDDDLARLENVVRAHLGMPTVAESQTTINTQNNRRKYTI